MGELERLLIQPGRDELWERHFPGKPERDQRRAERDDCLHWSGSLDPVDARLR